MTQRCPACRHRMHPLHLPGLQGRPLQADHCRACRLVWFDVLEPSALAQSAWIALLKEMACSARDEPPPVDEARACCPRCDAPLVVMPQVGMFGRSVNLACPDGHGLAQRDGALLASRGLFRPLTLDERVWLSTERRQLACLPCGARLTGEADHCTQCGSPATVFDLRRLSEALGLRGAADGGDIGGVTWIGSLTLAGYFFGNIPFIKNNLTLMVLVIVVISFIPAILEFIKHRRRQKQAD